MSRTQRLAATVSFAVVAIAGALAAVAPLLQEGLVLGGSACGGGGEEQRCIGIARQLSLVEISPRAWFFVLGGLLCVLLAAVGLVLVWRGGPSPLPVALAVLVVAFGGLAATERVDALLGPEGGGTWGRTLEDWGSFLSPALADLRRDALRRYEGKRTEPGGPLYDREQILDSFSVREQDGWRLLRRSVVPLFFAALFAAVSILAASLPLSITVTGTAGLVAWAIVYDRALRCDPGASDCYDGFATMLAIGLAVIWWAVYLLGAVVARRLR